MDNDNKISKSKNNENLHEEVMLFLGDEVEKIHQESDNKSYDIEKEYAKTKKNHSPYNFFVLFGAFIVVIVAVLIINKYITTKDAQIAVSLDEFEDLNLNTLLDTVTATKEKYEEALKNRLALEAELEERLNDLKADFENKLFVLDSLNLSDTGEYDRRKAEYEAEYNAKIDEINKDFEGKIILAKKQVDTYKTELDKFDSEKIASAQEKEKLINSERELRQLEIDRLTKSYEERLKAMDEALKDARSQGSAEMREAVQNVASKYQAEIDSLDPKLNDPRANIIMRTSNYTSDFDGADLLADAEVNDSGVVNSINEYQDMYDDYKYLDDVVGSIPQKYSIPKYVRTARNLVNDMSKTYVDTSVDYFKNIQELDKMIEDLNVQLELLNTQVDELNTQVDEQNQKLEVQNQKLEEQKQKMEEQKQQIESQKEQYEKQLQSTKRACENSISNIFTSLDLNAMLLSASGYNDIQISVKPEIQELIPASGITAKIVISGRKNITGTIVPKTNGTYYFIVDKDAAGNPVSVDFTKLEPGLPVEIIW